MPLIYHTSHNGVSRKPRLLAWGIVLWAGFLGAVVAFIAALWVTRHASLSMLDMTVLFLFQWLGCAVAAAFTRGLSNNERAGYGE